MRTLLIGTGIFFAIALTSSVPALAAKPAADTADTKGMSKDEKQKLAEHMKMRNHIEKDVKYPASKEDILAKCNGMKEVKLDDKKWFEEKLPTGTYNTSAEVEKALGWEVAEAAPAPAADAEKPAGKKTKK